MQQIVYGRLLLLLTSKCSPKPLINSTFSKSLFGNYKTSIFTGDPTNQLREEICLAEVKAGVFTCVCRQVNTGNVI